MASCKEKLGELEVIVGTYEEFLLGYKLTSDENDKYSLSMSFTNHSQSKSIRAVATLGKFVAAGSADETINLINMQSRVEHGSLQEQSGTITCLAQHEGNYLFSGCDDGTICIWKRGSWLCEKTLKAHTGGVVDISVHPSGKLALSIGKDKAMKTWNLVKGRCGYVTNLKVVADAVRWSPDGDFYAVSLSNRVDVYSLQTAKVVYSIPVGKRISCLSFVNNSVLIIAGDKEEVEVHDIESCKKLVEFNAHKFRVKAVLYVPDIDVLLTASNDGYIKLWRFPKGNFSKSPKLLAEIDTTCRVTCMTVWFKADAEEEDADDEEELEEEEVAEESDDDLAVDDSDDEKDEDSNESTDSDSDKAQKSVPQKKKVKLEQRQVQVSKSKGNISNQKSEMKQQKSGKNEEQKSKRRKVK